MQRSKTYRAAAEQFDADELHAPLTAIGIATSVSKKKFDETVDVVMRLGVDPRKADQMVRGTVNLPHGTGKTARVLVFAAGDKAEAAMAAGADEVGSDELIARVAAGYLDFDAVVATPDMMGKVGRLGRVLGPRGLMPNPKTGTVTPDQMGKIGRFGKVLGPRGLMPNPKTGTVTMDVTKAVEDAKGGKVDFRVDRQGNVHLVIGKASFSANELWANYNAVMEELHRLKPASAKGRYMRSIAMSTSQGPSIKVESRTRDEFEEAMEAAPDEVSV